MKDSFILHTDAWDNIKDLSNEQLGLLLKALMLNQRGEQLPEMDQVTRMAYKFISAQITRDNEKYDKAVERRREAGKRGAEARWQTHKSHAIDSHTDTETDTDTVTVTDTDTERYVSLAALPPLSPGDEALLRKTSGDERADALIGDVRNYYTAHPEKHFPGWPIALAQFDANQKRWGTAGRKKQKSIDEIIEEMTAEGAFD